MPDQIESDVGAVDSRLLRRDTGAPATFGVEIVEATRDRVILRMPATPAHRGRALTSNGLCAVLAEEAASLGAALNSPTGWTAAGIELGLSMLCQSSTMAITAVATPRGRYADYQVWDVLVTDDAGEQICASHCMVAMLRGGDPSRSVRPPADRRSRSVARPL